MSQRGPPPDQEQEGSDAEAGSSKQAAQGDEADAVAKDEPGDKARRRLQNRLHQRARRQRLKAVEKNPEETDQALFKVTRWRLGEESVPPLQKSVTSKKSRATTSSEGESSTSSGTNAALPVRDSGASLIPESSAVPMSVDHVLITLIQSNAFRGLYDNKRMLERFAADYVPDGLPSGYLPSPTRYPGYAAIQTMVPDGVIPESLEPSDLQKNYLHMTWINPLPFPQLRENLIRVEKSFDQRKFLSDIGGEGMRHWQLPVASRTNPYEDSLENQGDQDGSSNGLIIWGEPHLTSSWEATPGFVKRWAWLLVGCDDLLYHTNRWRQSRGEGPLAIEFAKMSLGDEGTSQRN